ncbi:hypothetical protein, partial [Bacteroides ovatus]|uniref:hypothetical protein n=1 Tax=Bacteroides ovatus TaxID=28116 RepID=UPI001E2B4933
CFIFIHSKNIRMKKGRQDRIAETLTLSLCFVCNFIIANQNIIIAKRKMLIAKTNMLIDYFFHWDD